MVIIKDNNIIKDKENNSMLTTIDNPYNPFTHFDEWYNFDVSHGYNSSSLLARIVKTSNELSDLDQSLAIEEAIDEIIKENILGIYIKVTKENFEPRLKEEESI